MEAPNKIYLSSKSFEIGEKFNGILTTMAEGDIEYTRTDSFIEKACSWLKNNLQGVVGGNIYIEDFRNYMEGE